MINNQRVPYFDVLNIIACIAVIALHHNGIVHWYDVHSVIWIQALVFEVFFSGLYLFSLCLQEQLY